MNVRQPFRVQWPMLTVVLIFVVAFHLGPLPGVLARWAAHAPRVVFEAGKVVPAASRPDTSWFFPRRS